MARRRIRVITDVIVDRELTTKEMALVRDQASVLVNTVPFSVEINDVKVDMSVERVRSIHEHDSTEDYLCAPCKDASRDRQNRDT